MYIMMLSLSHLYFLMQVIVPSFYIPDQLANSKAALILEDLV